MDRLHQMELNERVGRVDTKHSINKYMEPHPRMEELERWLYRGATISCGGAQARAEFYLDVVSHMIGGDLARRYNEEHS